MQPDNLRNELIRNNTYSFIKEYLILNSTEYYFNNFNHLKDYEKLNITQNFVTSIIDDRIIKEFIIKNYDKENYAEFIKTKYWQIISFIKKCGNFVEVHCAECGNTNDLQVHHKNYKRHGLEHTFEVINEDLIILCKECHQKKHNVEV